jgi:hypothetical protein
MDYSSLQFWVTLIGVIGACFSIAYLIWFIRVMSRIDINLRTLVKLQTPSEAEQTPPVPTGQDYQAVKSCFLTRDPAKYAPGIVTIVEGVYVEFLSEAQGDDGVAWIKVRTADGVDGWGHADCFRKL